MSGNANEKICHRQDQVGLPGLRFELNSSVITCHFIGDWRIVAGGSLKTVVNDWETFFKQNPGADRIILKVDSDLFWDSRLVSFLILKRTELDTQGFEIVDHFPVKLTQLFSLHSAKAVSSKFTEEQGHSLSAFFTDIFLNVSSPLNFLGAWIISLLSIPTLKTQMRIGDFIQACRLSGASALPIVTLISFLTGLTMAFVGSVQLEKFNAKIYTADLVCLAMVREMGALMVGIIMAGRTGASFAAELGNMKLNEELDALRTFGIRPMEFLVLPRTLSLIVMVPILVVYADIVGILGGLTVGVQVMDFSVSHYIEQTQSAIVGMWEVFSGLLKSVVFGLIIGLVGCYKGLHSGNNSMALGKSVTSAVVMSVTFIVIADALFEVIFNALELR
jgi:phospholipid/cholesterol/gamma-HCH transport system permease protein